MKRRERLYSLDPSHATNLRARLTSICSSVSRRVSVYSSSSSSSRRSSRSCSCCSRRFSWSWMLVFRRAVSSTPCVEDMLAGIWQEARERGLDGAGDEVVPEAECMGTRWSRKPYHDGVLWEKSSGRGRSSAGAQRCRHAGVVTARRLAAANVFSFFPTQLWNDHSNSETRRLDHAPPCRRCFASNPNSGGTTWRDTSRAVKP